MAKTSSKKKTSETVKAEIDRARETNAKRQEKIDDLRRKINIESLRIRRLEKLYKALNHEEMRDRVDNALFKNPNMTNEQILRLIELSEQIGSDIDTQTVIDVLSKQTATVNEPVEAVPQADEGEDDSEGKESE